MEAELIVIRYDPAGAIAQTAQNVGQFATDRALADESMRQKAFANDQSRQAASFALQGVNSAFGQRQQVDEQNFRRQQADVANNFRQQDLDQQNKYRMGQLDYQQQRGQDAYDVANLRGQYGLDREGVRQDGLDNRLGRTLDSRRDITDTLETGRNNRQVAGFDQQDHNREDNQSFLLDKMQKDEDFRRELNDNNNAFKQDQAQAQQEYGTTRDENRARQRMGEIEARKQQADQMAMQRAEARAYDQQRAALRDHRLVTSTLLNAAMQQSRNKDMYGQPTPGAAQAGQAVQSLQERLNQIDAQMNQLPAPPVPQAYGRQPPTMQPGASGGFSGQAPPQQPQQFDPSSQMVDEQAVRQVIASVKAQMPGASREQIKAAVAQQLIASGIDPSFLQ